MERAGHGVSVAGNGDDDFRLAIEAAGQIHLQLTGVVMANMSGPRFSGLCEQPARKKTLYMLVYPEMGEGSEALRIATQLCPKGVQPGETAAPSP
jgi:hypothetical protein